MQSTTVDIVWLKRDIRLADHGPLSEVSSSSSISVPGRPLLIIYNYEPDQLSEHSVHGSHVSFVNEGLVDLDQKLSGVSSACSTFRLDPDHDRDDVHHDVSKSTDSSDTSGTSWGTSKERTEMKAGYLDFDDSDGSGINISRMGRGDEKSKDHNRYCFKVIAVSHAGIVFTLNSILRQINAGSVFFHDVDCCNTPFQSASKIKSSTSKGTALKPIAESRIKVTGIHRILSHEETGHLKSFARDKAVRKWCRCKRIPIVEFNQTGVTRCLSSRDDFSKLFQTFIHKPLWETPSTEQLANMRSRLVTGLKLPNRCRYPLQPHLNEIQEIPIEHRKDRPERQKGGETEGHSTLADFFQNRARHYSSGISSPNTSWTTGGRISPYITWGNLSTRYVIHMLKRRQEEFRQRKASKTLNAMDGPFLRSLQAFSSRMHWRSHFIQKLETEPHLEKRDLCSSYQHLRRQESDWNEKYYTAWRTGTTGFPFVDACMRCLLKHGWLNFRMRAMLVSFATYNLWLDWCRIAPHLARVFLDYEPGIHYPQLQMQAGTTGINAMRVYNVTKQGKDQDPNGIFVKKYVPELRYVPVEYIHEPSRMTKALQERCKVIIGTVEFCNEHAGIGAALARGSGQTKTMDIVDQIKESNVTKDLKETIRYYPKPIVNEKETAKLAKDKLSSIRKLGSTKRNAEKVYIKHGSRSSRNGNMDGTKPKALSSTVKRIKLDASMESGQIKINEMFRRTNGTAVTEDKHDIKSQSSVKMKVDHRVQKSQEEDNKLITIATPSQDAGIKKLQQSPWTCSACTFLNEKPLALACSICGTIRYGSV